MAQIMFFFFQIAFLYNHWMDFKLRFFFNGGIVDTKHDIVSVVQHNDSIFVHIMK